MADETANLILAQLRAIRGDLAEINRHIANIEQEAISQGRLTALLVNGQAQARARFAELESRLDRIEKRLSLTEA